MSIECVSDLFSCYRLDNSEKEFLLWWLLIDPTRHKSRQLPTIGLGLDFNVAMVNYLGRKDHKVLAQRFEEAKEEVENKLGIGEAAGAPTGCTDVDFSLKLESATISYNFIVAEDYRRALRNLVHLKSITLTRTLNSGILPIVANECKGRLEKIRCGASQELYVKLGANL
jgi:hypothetical protein